MTNQRAVRLVIADDHQVIREGLRAIVETTGGEIQIVGEAKTGLEAVSLAEALRPDVILLDIQMPGADGVEATRRIREAQLPSAVVILTSFDDDERIRSAIQAGALGYLLKDVPKDELLNAIRAAARGRATLDPAAQQVLMRQVSEPAAVSPFAALTPRERDVLRLIARGSSNKEIAAALYLSVGTIKGYVSAILPKIGVGDRTQAALFAVKHGLS